MEEDHEATKREDFFSSKFEERKKILLHEIFSKRNRSCLLTQAEKEKLYALLWGIAAAEQSMILTGKRVSRWIRACGMRIPGGTTLFKTLGSWNMHVCHAKKFGLTQKEFRKVLVKDHLGITYVVDYILKFIGLEKEPQFIFAEYYFGEHATSIVALQKGLNDLLLLEKLPKIDEDGIYGQETRQALHSLKSLAQIQNLEPTNAENLSKMIERVSHVAQKQISPFIPQVRSERDFKYVYSVLRESLRNPIRISRILNFFRNRVDIPNYVEEAMRVFAKTESLFSNQVINFKNDLKGS